MFDEDSFQDKGTLYHLKILLNQHKVTFKDSKIKDFNACDDFFKVCVTSHIVAAAMELLNMETIDDAQPSNNALVPEDDWLQDSDIRRDTLYRVSHMIVSTYVDIEATFSSASVSKEDDKLLEYSRLVLSIGLLYMEFCDGIKEGDGTRILRCWRFMLLFFKSTNRKNYAIEAFTLLSQYHFLYSKRQAQQLLWGRFVNTHGLPARNIPCDLYMEHLNRVCKDAVTCLHANKTPEALVKVGKVVGILDEILKNFDKEHTIKEKSGKHAVASYRRDMNTIVGVLVSEEVFKYLPSRCHLSFPNTVRNPSRNIDHEKLISWMYMHLNHLIHGF